jgi:hypothetical protein
MNLLPEVQDRLPQPIKDRLSKVEDQVEKIIAKGRAVLATDLPGSIAFHQRRGRASPVRAKRLGSSLASASTQEGICKDIVGDSPALRDAVRLVERPVDSQIDATLPVLFLGL